MDPITQQVVLATAGAAAAGDPTYVDDVFSTYLYTGTGSTRTITNGIDLSGEGGLVWIKSRDSGSLNHHLYDTERGATKFLMSNSTSAEITSITDNLTQFNSNGFDLGAWMDVNNSGLTFASWTFRKAPGFFDVVTYTGTGSAQNISHSLGSVPGMILVKSNSSDGTNWMVYHRSLGGTKNLYLNGTAPAATNSAPWNDTAPTSSVFTVGTDNSTNGNGNTYVAYIFAHDDQSFGTDSDEAIIKCGSYTGSGSDGNFVNVGFEPQWLMIKNTSSSSTNWLITDVMRGMPAKGGTTNVLAPNSNAAETTQTNIAPNGAGFTLAGAGSYSNKSGNTFIYMAIRRPHKPPTAGTEVFAIDNQGTGTMPPQYHSNFVVDWAINVAFGESQTYRYRHNFTRLLGRTALKLNETSAEISFSSARWDYMDGFYNNNSSVSTTYAWMFKRTPGFFDVVAFKGTGSARTLDHNLAAIPELVIVKNRENGSYGWSVYVSHLSSPRDKAMYLNDTMAAQTNNAGTFWGNSDFTSTQISLGDYANTNHNNINMIAYLFATLDGISKVGTFSGTGSDINVDCGFTAGARFVMIKRTDTEISGATGTNWYVWDSTRGIVSGNDPYFLLNTDDAEVTNTDYIDPLNAGFTVTSSAPAALNTSGGTYLFLAIA